MSLGLKNAFKMVDVLGLEYNFPGAPRCRVECDGNVVALFMSWTPNSRDIFIYIL